MTPFPSIPVSQSSNRTTSNDINVVRFGNGYEQRVPFGINFQRDKWNVIWENKSATDKNTLVVFLQSIASGDYTLWQSPFDSVQKKFVIDGDWSIQDTGGNIYTLQCTLRQVYDLQ